MSAFKVGDVCVVVYSKTAPDVIGLQVTLVRRYAGPAIHRDGLRREVDGWIVDCSLQAVPGSNGEHVFGSSQLRRIDPPSEYDGNKAGDWDLCPFKPKQVRTLAGVERVS